MGDQRDESMMDSELHHDNITPAPYGANDSLIDQLRMALDNATLELKRLADVIRVKDELIVKKDETITALITQLHTRPSSPVRTTVPSVSIPQPGSIPMSSTSSKTTKLRDPETFNGEATKIHTFVTDCYLKFDMEPINFQNDFLKIGWASTHLGGNAKIWWTALYKQNMALPHDSRAPELRSFPVFVEKLTALFGDPDLRSSKANELRALKQNGSVAEYIAQFKTIAQYLQYNDQALLDIFKAGLTRRIQQLIAMRENEPTFLQDYMDVANRVDAKTNPQKFDVGFGPSLFYANSYRPAADKPSVHRSQDKNPGSSQHRTYAGVSTPATAFRTTTTPTAPIAPVKQVSPATTPAPRSSIPRPQAAAGIPATSKDGTIPMELDASRRNGITPEERQRRKDDNLCLYCGSPEHYNATCPLRPNRPGRRVYAVQGTPVFISDAEDLEVSTNDHAQE
jgi:hypothetical protein